MPLSSCSQNPEVQKGATDCPKLTPLSTASECLRSGTSLPASDIPRQPIKPSHSSPHREMGEPGETSTSFHLHTCPCHWHLQLPPLPSPRALLTNSAPLPKSCSSLTPALGHQPSTTEVSPSGLDTNTPAPWPLLVVWDLPCAVRVSLPTRCQQYCPPWSLHC